MEVFSKHLAMKKSTQKKATLLFRDAIKFALALFFCPTCCFASSSKDESGLKRFTSCRMWRGL